MIDITHTVPDSVLLNTGASEVGLTIFEDDFFSLCLMETGSDHAVNISIIWLTMNIQRVKITLM